LVAGTLIFVLTTPLLQAEDATTEQSVIKKGVVGIKLWERRALLVEWQKARFSHKTKLSKNPAVL